MKLKFMGAAGEVTGSSFLLTTDNLKILIDLGMFQGSGANEKNRNLELVAAEADAVVLTHAHLDHCGRLPLLIKKGFKGKVFANKATVDLVYLVLKDAARVSEIDSKGNTAIYSEDEVEELMQKFEIVEYDQWKEILGSVKIRLIDAGHILGSSSVEIDIKGKRMVFSGDLGNTPSTIVRATKEPTEGEIVVMESTYGDRLHPKERKENEIISSLCVEAEKNGGTVLMPAFSLERTQELLLIFDHLKREGKISEKLPVYLDSPMGLKATGIYEKYPQLFNSELQQQRKWDDPFDFPGLVLVEKGVQSKKVDQVRGAKVIIAGSGMMTGGRIVFHVRRWISDPKTVLIFTGYQAEGTLGREILEGKKNVYVDGLEVEVKAKIEDITSMSAHADQEQLMDWLKGIKGTKKVILVHGEDSARKIFKEKIERELGHEVLIPVLQEEIEL